MLSSTRTLAFVFSFLVALSAGTELRAQDGARHPAKDLQLEAIEWRTDGAEFHDKKRFKTAMTREEKAFDRNALVDAALAEAKRTNRPVLCYVYKISEKTKRGRQMIRAPVLDVYMRQVVWSDPDVQRIVNSSFVPVRTVFDDALCERFSVKPLSFLEPAIVFLSPNGEMLHELRTIRTFDAGWIAGVLRDVLDKTHGPLVSDDLEAAKDRGDWQRALAIVEVGKVETAAQGIELAKVLRRLRRGDEALAALSFAQNHIVVTHENDKPKQTQRRTRRRGLRMPQPLQGQYLDVMAERGALLISMGRFDEALAPLQKAADAAPSQWGEGKSRRAEARYRLALLDLRTGNESRALRAFRQIIQDDPDDLWARRADVNLRVGVDDGLSLGAPMFGYERLQWLPEGAYTKLAGNTHWPAKPFTEAEVIDNCVRALLAQQRGHGGWTDSRYAYCPDARITPNVWVAISAICCQALLRHRDAFAQPELIDEALARGERFLFDPSQMNRGRNEDVYADSYRLLYLAHRWQVATNDQERKRAADFAVDVVAAARTRQKTGGFWAHEYSNAFCTAAMVEGLLAARSIGVDVADDMLSQAATALVSARSKDGAFSYGGAARGKPSAAGRKNASTRMPMCEGALLALGASDQDRLAFAFDNFWEHYAAIESVRHTDFHSEGQIAGFMFLHSLYHTSEAARLLPEERAQTERRKLRKKLMQYPEIDGTFLDSEELGRSYGTAMALLILANTKS